MIKKKLTRMIKKKLTREIENALATFVKEVVNSGWESEKCYDEVVRDTIKLHYNEAVERLDEDLETLIDYDQLDELIRNDLLIDTDMILKVCRKIGYKMHTSEISDWGMEIKITSY